MSPLRRTTQRHVHSPPFGSLPFRFKIAVRHVPADSLPLPIFRFLKKPRTCGTRESTPIWSARAADFMRQGRGGMRFTRACACADALLRGEALRDRARAPHGDASNLLPGLNSHHRTAKPACLPLAVSNVDFFLGRTFESAGNGLRYLRQHEASAVKTTLLSNRILRWRLI